MPLAWVLVAVLLAFAPAPQGEPPRIDANDNRAPAGRESGGVLRVQLEARLGRWYPQAAGRSVTIQVFAEAGRRAQIPGPLLRVRAGTRIEATIHNTLSGSPLVIHGLHPRPGSPSDSVIVASGATRVVRFLAGAPGTYFYWASTRGHDLENRDAIESQLSGAIVVDPAEAAGPPRDRVFVLGTWHVPTDSTGPKPWVDMDEMVINGKSWPHTERFTYTAGDTVRWRWVNPTADGHPMHLHGFYYSVDSRGTWSGDTLYAPPARRMVVTELLVPGTTMSATWVASTPGHWLFHCHFAFHVSQFLAFEKIPDPVDPGAPEAVDHSVHGMRGLVLGLEVRPRPGAAPVASAPPTVPRPIRLLIQTARARYDTSPGYGFVAQDVPRTIPRDSVPVLSSMLVLHRGEPVRISVVNHLRAPSSIHWHGIELTDSYFDGVPGWSGSANRLAPLIPPGDSFAVAFTPPRAGTFIYHSHSNEGHQIASGLYGALIVLPPGQAFDTTTERVFIVGGNGPDFDRARINGQLEPRVQTLIAGRTYRFRIIQIEPDLRVFVSLMADSVRQPWRAIAKDGADLPPSQAIVRTARVSMGPGETADFEFTPRAGGMVRLEVAAQTSKWRASVPLRVIR